MIQTLAVPLIWLVHRAFDLLEWPMKALQARLGQRHIAWVFVAPNLLIFGLFSFLPIILNLVYATTGGGNVLPSERSYVGTENFAALLRCDSFLDPNTCEKDLFWRALFNTWRFVFLQVGCMVLVALVTAIILDREIKGRGFFRAVFFYPVLLSPVVVALIWKWILQRDGVMNGWLAAAGSEPVLWLQEANWSFFWVVFVSIWAHMGFYMLILLAGLQAIPKDVYEAAEMDNANPWRVFYRITLPLLAPNMLVVLVLALIKGVQTFDEIYVLTAGGPGSATLLMVQYIYETGFAFQPRLYGLAAAASLMLAAVLMVLTLVQLWLNRKSYHG